MGTTPDQFQEWDKIEEQIRPLFKDRSSQEKWILDLFKTSYKFAKENYGTLSLKIVGTALRELRYSFKIFQPYLKTPKITIFGSARTPVGTPLYEMAKEFGEKAVKRGFLIITGGGPGIMAAGNEGAQTEGGFGLNIRLPVEQSANPFIDPDKKLLHYKYFFTRKLFLVKEAAGFAFFPGGFGTFDEAFEVLTLLQTGKTTLIPVVMVEPKGFNFWEAIVELLHNNLEAKGFISRSDRNLYRVCHSVDEALDHIENFYRVFHSSRMVRDKIVLRLKQRLPDSFVDKLSKEYAVLTGNNPIVQTTALAEEANEPEFVNLTRLVFPFAKFDYGLVRQLIDEINEV